MTGQEPAAMADPKTDCRLRLLFRLGRPLAPVYGAIMRLRAWLYQKNLLPRHHLPATIISIGNLTLGGTGKTPMAIYIARLLQQAGRCPAVISRGYGGSARTPINVVSNGQDILMEPAACGDEPRLIAESLPGVLVLTGKKRAAVGRYAIEHLQADAIILDDGFQHLAIDRDLDLVLFNAHSLTTELPLRSSRVLPGGPLRERPAALERAQAFVVTGITDTTRAAVDQLQRMLATRFPGRPLFTGAYRVSGLMRHDNQPPAPSLATVKQMKLYAFCGIAEPNSFQHELTRNGFTICGFTSFTDHHAYSAADLASLRRQAIAAGAQGFITTAKDFVKLRTAGDQKLPVFSLSVELDMEPGFDRFLAERLGLPRT